MAFTLFSLEIKSNAKSLAEIKRLLRKIMATQEEFNTKIEALNEAVTGIQASLGDIQTAINAEAEQIRQFIENNPSVDTSALDGIVTRLQTVSTQANTLDDNVSNIFAPTEG